MEASEAKLIRGKRIGKMRSIKVYWFGREGKAEAEGKRETG